MKDDVYPKLLDGSVTIITGVRVYMWEVPRIGDPNRVP